MNSENVNLADVDEQEHQQQNVNYFGSISEAYSDRIALVLKLGAGGDQQHHVHSPKSIKADSHRHDSISNIKDDYETNKFSSYHSGTNQTRATSAIGHIQKHKQYKQPQSNKARRPFSDYHNQQETLKRIKSELETIHENNEGRNVDNPYANSGLVLDESYSFSLRQFERAQQSNRQSNLQASQSKLEKGLPRSQLSILAEDSTNSLKLQNTGKSISSKFLNLANLEVKPHKIKDLSARNLKQVGTHDAMFIDDIDEQAEYEDHAEEVIIEEVVSN